MSIVCSGNGNKPNILARLSAHRRAVFAVLPAGLAKGHRGNPAAGMRVERLYGTPVLLSGLATMVLTKPEIGLIAGHYKQHVERLLKLHQATPECVVWFIGGSLPLTAQLHLRQLTLYGMLARLNNGNNILARLARNMFASAKPSYKSRKYFFIIPSPIL